MCLWMVREWSIIFCCRGWLGRSNERLLGTRGLICTYLGGGVSACCSTSLGRSISRTAGRSVSMAQAYTVRQSCLLWVNRSCPQPFPTNLAPGQRAWRARRSPGHAKPAGSCAGGKGAVPLAFQPPSRSGDRVAQRACPLLSSALLLRK